MTIIKELSEMIEEELEGAENYAEKAVLYKETHPGLAKVLYDISMEEMRHVDMLHGEITAIIERHRREHGEPPQVMMAVYEHLHKKNIEWAKEIRIYQAHYKGT